MNSSLSFAYTPPPLDDEPLDGYLEYVAHRLAVPVAAVYGRLGICRTRAYAAARGLTDEQTAGLCAALNLSPDRVSAMTLRRYDPVGLMPREDRGRGKRGAFWARSAGARYCPQCLQERNLRWRLHWYLHWSFVCVEHRALLASRCLTCGGAVRSSRYGHPVDARSAGKASAIEDGLCRCFTTALARLATSDVVTPHKGLAPILVAQQQVRAVIESPHALIDYFGTPTSAIAWMRDLAALTRRLLVHLPADHIPPEYVDVLAGMATDSRLERISATETSRRLGVDELMAAWSPCLGLASTRSPAARFSDAARSPVAFAVAATAATRVLTSPTCSGARDLIETLLPLKARREAVSLANARSLSWNLIKVLEDPTTARRPATARSIRFGSARYRSDGTERWPLDASRIPARAWPSLRAASPWIGASPYMSLVVSTALLRIATGLKSPEACKLLDHPHLGTRVAYEIGPLLAAAPGAEYDHFEDLVRLHDAVSTAAVPIDYTRRRRTFRGPTQIPERTARSIARELDLRPTPRLRTFMAWWVFEALTGSDVLLSEPHLHLPGPVRHAYARQRAEWDTQPPSPLTRRAEHALLVNGLDEPITWMPRLGSDGAWTLPPPNLDRTLDGWQKRHIRGNRRDSEEHSGLTLQEHVAYASSQQSVETFRLAVRLTRFKTVADVGTITQAAAQLGIRQPTLSQAMRTLERQLNVALLERTHHGFTLTKQGRDLRRLIGRSPLATVDPRQRLNPPANCSTTEEDERSAGTSTF
jgi:hypothetical protein